MILTKGLKRFARVKLRTAKNADGKTIRNALADAAMFKAMDAEQDKKLAEQVMLATDAKRLMADLGAQAPAPGFRKETILGKEFDSNRPDEYLKRQMEKHFFGDGADAVQGYVPPSA